MSDESSTSPEPSDFRAPTITFGPETRYFYTVLTPELVNGKVWYVWVPIQGQFNTVDILTLMANCVSHTQYIDEVPDTVYSEDERGGVWVEYFTSPHIKCADVMLRLYSHLKKHVDAVRVGYDIDLTTKPYTAPEESSSSSSSSFSGESPRRP
ncbi:hypothetical protein P168DRAFT_321761 [Aspergillus campestris IBT 28561]|uniref:Uncharacterized protein n=1 Tax=Aspergillus campestris (strain IBT 28561) TaxID=1392248 RepID=A0A2I1CSV2_ASPC2|nr:uncharacterized protein P168DRAFT_321761 [Aspergillus campestris IBT 28561]PKY00691.1 hypothetical protein P168DRAFT_321761 [Aspergillus campestris IBT 28561]